MRLKVPIFLVVVVVVLVIFGNVTKANRTPVVSAKPSFSYAVVRQGDTLNSLARIYHTNGARIYDANISIRDPLKLPVGVSIRIPSAEEVLPNRPLPYADMVSLAESLSDTQVLSSGAGVWDKLAQCESGGNWHIKTGNGYYGGVQFEISSWQLVGGNGLPNEASREEQISRAQKLLSLQGWQAWPVCSKKIGLD